MRIRIKVFAILRERLGWSDKELEVPEGSSVSSIKDLLLGGIASPAGIPVLPAVNRGYATLDRVLLEGDELAFIPPVSGG